MGAQPKNKITRVEQGKRRAGNTPKLNKDVKFSRVPLHKKGLFEKLLRVVTNSPAPEAEVAKAAKKAAAKAANQTNAPGMATQKATMQKGGATVKKTARTQHKGG